MSVLAYSATGQPPTRQVPDSGQFVPTTDGAKRNRDKIEAFFKVSLFHAATGLDARGVRLFHLVRAVRRIWRRALRVTRRKVEFDGFGTCEYSNPPGTFLRCLSAAAEQARTGTWRS